MRILTLDEKITIKGELSKYGVYSSIYVAATMDDLLSIYYLVSGKPLVFAFKAYAKFRKPHKTDKANDPA